MPLFPQLERMLEGSAVRAQKQLVLLHREDGPPPQGTVNWLNMRSWISRHLHLSCPRRVFSKRSLPKLVGIFHLSQHNMAQIHFRVSSFIHSLTSHYLAFFFSWSFTSVYLRSLQTATLISPVWLGFSLVMLSLLSSEEEGPGKLIPQPVLLNRHIAAIFNLLGFLIRGCSQVGIMRALCEAGIPVDLIGGTSIGALMGALYAEDRSLSRMRIRAREWAMVRLINISHASSVTLYNLKVF